MTRFISNLIVRPPRRTYTDAELRDTIFLRSAPTVVRVPVSFENARGETIVGSMYPAPRPAPRHPCVLYLHGNASSQIEGSFLASALCERAISLLCIDTSGCGNSDGATISLGLRERADVKAAIEFARREFGVERVVIWGRSMGAAIAAWYAGEEGDVDGIIADSPYCSIAHIADDLCGSSWCLWALKCALFPLIRRHISKTYGFSVDDVNVIDHVHNAQCPALFVHAAHDTFIRVREGRELYARYGGEKYMLTVPGNHNSQRPMSVQTTELMFIARVFGLDSAGAPVRGTAVSDNSSAHFENAFEMMKSI